MVAPPVILVGLFVAIPIVIAVYLSMTDWDGFTLPPTWIGPQNYIKMFQDPEVAQAAQLTGLITVIGVVLCNAVGLGVALLLNGRGKFKSLMRMIVFYPYVIGPVIIGFLWSSILGTNGAINAMLQAAHSSTIPFLADPVWAVWTTIAIIVWTTFGMNVVLYLAGLQTIDESMIEAAKLDGANEWQTFWKVKVPLLAPTITVNIVLVVVGLLRVYELILALTAGGPAAATQSIVFHILSTSFQRAQLGYGAAQSIVLLVVIVAVTIGITAARRRSEEAVSS
jgi:ABC-type sugar transport system permease subunit